MNRKYHQGLTLIEMMIALLLSLLLMAGVVRIMSSSKQTYALQTELATLQEDARFIMDDIATTVRMAGYYGYSGNRPVNLSSTSFVRFHCTGCDKTFSAGNMGTTSDTLTISYFAPTGKLMLKEYSNTGSDGAKGIALPSMATLAGNTALSTLMTNIKEENTHEFGNKTFVYLEEGDSLPKVVSGDPIIVSNFSGSMIYTVSGNPSLVSTSGTTKVMQASFQIPSSTNVGNDIVIDLDKTADKEWDWPVEVFKAGVVKSTHYKVENGKFYKCEGTSCPNDAEPVIEGVQNMQVFYGVDTNSDGVANRFQGTLPASADDVVSVRVNLLMRTINRRYDIKDTTNKVFDLDRGISYETTPSPTPTQSYNPASNVDVESGYRHRLFTTTIYVRNS